jgi:hypothetical protein
MRLSLRTCGVLAAILIALMGAALANARDTRETGRTFRLVTGDTVVIRDIGWHCSLNMTAYGKALVCQTARDGNPFGKAASYPLVLLRGSEAAIGAKRRPTVEPGPYATYKFAKVFGG